MIGEAVLAKTPGANSILDKQEDTAYNKESVLYLTDKRGRV